MSKDNQNFFAHKSEWAVLKDDLLGCYLIPYLQKILATNKPLLYVDGFAGKGMFDDGSKGSPVIACDCINYALRNTQTNNNRIDALFVEKNYAKDLAANVSNYGFARSVQGEYSTLGAEMDAIQSSDVNLFLYVDPYGVKHLDQSFFLGLKQRFSSVELLINFNSFGFFRAACSAYNIIPNDISADDDYLVERDDGTSDSVPASIEKLNRAYGSTEWTKILDAYRHGRIDGYEAERRIAAGYCAILANSYTYVQNLPIRLREHNHPKYRMIHATNHHDGCLLMYDEMYKHLVDMKDIQHNGQMQLFVANDVGEFVDDREIRNDLLDEIEALSDYVQLETLLAKFVAKTGLTLPTKVMRKMIREFESAGLIDVRRNPSRTARGSQSAFMESKGRNRLVEVRRRCV